MQALVVLLNRLPAPLAHGAARLLPRISRVARRAVVPALPLVAAALRYVIFPARTRPTVVESVVQPPAVFVLLPVVHFQAPRLCLPMPAALQALGVHVVLRGPEAVAPQPEYPLR